MTAHLSRSKPLQSRVSTDGETLALIARATTDRYHRMLSQDVQSLQQCLGEQERLLSTAPDFSDRAMVLNSNRAALNLVRRIQTFLQPAGLPATG